MFVVKEESDGCYIVGSGTRTKCPNVDSILVVKCRCIPIVDLKFELQTVKKLVVVDGLICKNLELPALMNVFCLTNTIAHNIDVPAVKDSRVVIRKECNILSLSFNEDFAGDIDVEGACVKVVLPKVCNVTLSAFQRNILFPEDNSIVARTPLTSLVIRRFGRPITLHQPSTLTDLCLSKVAGQVIVCSNTEYEVLSQLGLNPCPSCERTDTLSQSIDGIALCDECYRMIIKHRRNRASRINSLISEISKSGARVGFTKMRLRQMCRDQGLRQMGSKLDLRTRLIDALKKELP